MYNGVGLPTARGTGTSGYIQRNLSQFKEKHNKSTYDYSPSSQPSKSREPNTDLLKHERLRQIEIECLRLRDSLEQDPSYTQEKIDLEVNNLRLKLNKSHVDLQLEQATDSHRMAKLKNERMENMQSALHISKNSYEGKAFQNIKHNN